MKFAPLTILAFLPLLSCKSNHSYKYIEFVREAGLLGGPAEIKNKEPKLIEAENDSAAYLDAYKTYCISQKVTQDMAKTMGQVYSTPVGFKVLNDKGADITNAVFFPGKAKQEQEIKENIFAMRNTIQDAFDKNKEDKANELKTAGNTDPVKAKGLLKYFRVKSDEFSNDNAKWYTPKTAPTYANRNGIYCYFQTVHDVPSNFRLRIQYYADDWLFFSRVQFSIDGKAYEYVPVKTETDNGDGYIWEWSDESVGDTDKPLIRALANAKTAKMKFIGQHYFDIKTISPTQLASIKQAIELFEAMGGTL